MVTKSTDLMPDVVDELVDDGEPFDEGGVNERDIPSGTPARIVGHERDPREVTVWDMRTGVPSTIRLYENNATLEKQLRKIDTDPASNWYGKRIYTRRNPAMHPELFLTLPIEPSYPCWFSERNPHVDRFSRILGINARCKKKGNFASPESVKAHVENKHPRWYKQINEHDTRAREDERDARDTAMMQAILDLARGRADENEVKSTRRTRRTVDSAIAVDDNTEGENF